MKLYLTNSLFDYFLKRLKWVLKKKKHVVFYGRPRFFKNWIRYIILNYEFEPYESNFIYLSNLEIQKYNLEFNNNFSFDEIFNERHYESDFSDELDIYNVKNDIVLYNSIKTLKNILDYKVEIDLKIKLASSFDVRDKGFYNIDYSQTSTILNFIKYNFLLLYFLLKRNRYLPEKLDSKYLHAYNLNQKKTNRLPASVVKMLTESENIDSGDIDICVIQDRGTIRLFSFLKVINYLIKKKISSFKDICLTIDYFQSKEIFKVYSNVTLVYYDEYNPYSLSRYYAAKEKKLNVISYQHALYDDKHFLYRWVHSIYTDKYLGLLPQESNFFIPSFIEYKYIGTFRVKYSKTILNITNKNILVMPYVPEEDSNTFLYFLDIIEKLLEYGYTLTFSPKNDFDINYYKSILRHPRVSFLKKNTFNILNSDDYLCAVSLNRSTVCLELINMGFVIVPLNLTSQSVRLFREYKLEVAENMFTMNDLFIRNQYEKCSRLNRYLSINESDNHGK